MFHFYTSGFLMFSGGTEVEHWLKMGLKKFILETFYVKMINETFGILCYEDL